MCRNTWVKNQWIQKWTSQTLNMFILISKIPIEVSVWKPRFRGWKAAASGTGENNKILAVKPENLCRVCPAQLPSQCSGLLVQGVMGGAGVDGLSPVTWGYFGTCWNPERTLKFVNIGVIYIYIYTYIYIHIYIYSHVFKHVFCGHENVSCARHGTAPGAEALVLEDWGSTECSEPRGFGRHAPWAATRVKKKSSG